MSVKRKMFRNSIRASLKERQREFRKGKHTPNFHEVVELVKKKTVKQRVL